MQGLLVFAVKAIKSVLTKSVHGELVEPRTDGP